MASIEAALELSVRQRPGAPRSNGKAPGASAGMDLNEGVCIW